MDAPLLRVAVVARAVLPMHGFGGLERSVRDLVRHLAERDVDVTLIVPPPRPVLRHAAADPFASPRIHLRHVRYLTFPYANRRGTTILDRSTAYLLYGQRAGRLAGRLAAAGEIDVVHGFGASVLGYGRAKVRPVPLVLNPQGLEEFGATAAALPAAKRLGYGPLRWAVRRVARAADCVIATDAALENTVRRHLRLKPNQLRTVPNGIDLLEATSLAGPAEGAILRQRAGLSLSDFVILSVGRLEQNKGFEDLALALGEAARHGGLRDRPWRWVLVGSGPRKAAIERAVARAGIEAHARLIGRANEADLHAWYEAATIFAHPTRYEGSSLVTLEAMAHRKPVIATRAGGLPDKVRPGVNGWLVDTGDISGLSASIGEAVEAGDHLPALGESGRQIVEREFSWAVLARTQISIYQELIAQRRR